MLTKQAFNSGSRSLEQDSSNPGDVSWSFAKPHELSTAQSIIEIGWSLLISWINHVAIFWICQPPMRGAVSKRKEMG
jgi:hypothetical protein